MPSYRPFLFLFWMFACSIFTMRCVLFVIFPRVFYVLLIAFRTFISVPRVVCSTNRPWEAFFTTFPLWAIDRVVVFFSPTFGGFVVSIGYRGVKSPRERITSRSKECILFMSIDGRVEGQYEIGYYLDPILCASYPEVGSSICS